MPGTKEHLLAQIVRGRAGMELGEYLASRRNANASVRTIVAEVNQWIAEADLTETISRETIYRYISKHTRRIVVPEAKRAAA